MLKKILKAILPKIIVKGLNQIRFEYFDGYAQKVYSQEGEDLVLHKIFSDKPNGFYVDVGAHHPACYSNTFIFYKQGWHGINIDAMPNSMNAFNRIRPRDINIETPISDKKEVLTYYAFNAPALNGFSKELSESRDGLRDFKIIFQKDMETQTLEEILDAHLPEGQEIDFLSIDVEGLDFQVLRSNNWNKYRPEVVLIEALDSNIEKALNSEISQYMQNHGYNMIAKTFNTVFFRKAE